MSEANLSIKSPINENLIDAISTIYIVQIDSDLEKITSNNHKLNNFNERLYKNEKNGKKIDFENKIRKIIYKSTNSLNITNEELIFSLIYYNRIARKNNELTLTIDNFRLIFIISLLVAKKFSNDSNSKKLNKCFQEFCKFITIKKFNALVLDFLDSIEYNCLVSNKLFIQYLLELSNIFQVKRNNRRRSKSVGNEPLLNTLV